MKKIVMLLIIVLLAFSAFSFIDTGLKKDVGVEKNLGKSRPAINCGDIITKSVTLKASDPVTYEQCDSFGLKLNSPNIVLDCDGHSITGDINQITVNDRAIIAKDVSNLKVKNCNFRGFDIGIRIENINRVEISSNNFEVTGTSIKSYNTKGAIVAGNVFNSDDSYSSYALFIKGGGKHVLRENEFINGGIYVDSDPHIPHILVHDNYFESSDVLSNTAYIIHLLRDGAPFFDNYRYNVRFYRNDFHSGRIDNFDNVHFCRRDDLESIGNYFSNSFGQVNNRVFCGIASDPFTRRGLLDPDADGLQESDNCPEHFNPNQDDADSNGIGDACDWNDREQGPNENGIDCGGENPTGCAVCYWCEENGLEPIEINGYTGTIDVVFSIKDYDGFSWIEREYHLDKVIRQYKNWLRDSIENVVVVETGGELGLQVPDNFDQMYNFYYAPTENNNYPSWADVVHELYVGPIYDFLGKEIGGQSQGIGRGNARIKTRLDGGSTVHELGHGLFNVGDTYNLKSFEDYGLYAFGMSLLGSSPSNYFASRSECWDFADQYAYPRHLCNSFFHTFKFGCVGYEGYSTGLCKMGNFPFLEEEFPTESRGLYLDFKYFYPPAAISANDVLHNWDQYNSYDPGAPFAIFSNSAISGSAIATGEVNGDFLNRLRNFLKDFTGTGQAVKSKIIPKVTNQGIMVGFNVVGDLVNGDTKFTSGSTDVVLGYHKYTACTGLCFDVRILDSKNDVLKSFSISDPRMIFDAPSLDDAEGNIYFKPPFGDVKKLKLIDRRNPSNFIVVDISDEFAEFCSENRLHKGCKKSSKTTVVGKWSAEKNAKDNYGKNNGKLNNVNFAKGKKGFAFDFKGKKREYVDLPTSVARDGEFSISVWVKPRSGPTKVGRTVLSTYRYGGRGGKHTGWNFGDPWGKNDHFNFYVIGDDRVRAVANVNGWFKENRNKWVHMVGTFKPGKYVRLYQNGVLVAEDTTKVPNTVSHHGKFPVRVGSRADSLNAGNFDGLIDEVVIYNKALNNEEISRIYRSK